MTCSCVLCVACRGTGQVMVAQDGYPEQDLETCSDCGGTGISEKCGACIDKEQDDDYV